MSIATSTKYNTSTGVCAGTLNDLVSHDIMLVDTSSHQGDHDSGSVDLVNNSITIPVGCGNTFVDYNYCAVYVNELTYSPNNNDYKLQLYRIGITADLSTAKGGLSCYYRAGKDVSSGSDATNLGYHTAFGTSTSCSNKSIGYVYDNVTNYGFFLGNESVSAVETRNIYFKNLSFDLGYAHTLSLTQKSNGSLSFGSASTNNGYSSASNNISNRDVCAVGKNIKLTATPATGYEVDKWWDGRVGDGKGTITDKAISRDDFAVTESNNTDFWVTFKPHIYYNTYSLRFIDKTLNADGTYTYTALTNNHSSVNSTKFDTSKDFNNKTSYEGGSANFSLANPKNIYGYRFLGWVDVTEGTKTAQEAATQASSITINPRTSPADRKFEAVYELVHFQVSYTYRDNYGKTDYWGNDWNTVLTNQTTYTVRDLSTKFSAVPTRTGYTFYGYQIENENGDYLKDLSSGLPPDGTGDVTLVLVFAYNRLDVKVEPVLVNGEIDKYKKWWDNERPNIFVKNLETKEQGSSIKVDYIDGFNRLEVHVISIEDDDTYTGKYNPRIYKFLGWRRKIDQQEIGKTHIISGLSLHHDDRYNIYEAVFELINYSIDIQMYDSEEGKICGEILTSKGAADKENISYNDNGLVKISNLVFGEERDITIIPHAINESQTYFLEKWDAKNSNAIFTAKIDNALTNTSLEKSIRFSIKNLDTNSINSLNDKQKVIELFGKTITEFIMADNSKIISELGDYGFYNCNKLQYVYMPTCAKIGDNTFENCTNLKNIVISSASATAPDIGTNTFLNCKNLTSIVLPYNFVYLGTIFSPWDMDPPQDPDIGYTIESYQSLFRKGLGRIYVPQCLLKQYQEADQWSCYADVICSIEDNPNVYKGNYKKEV